MRLFFIRVSQASVGSMTGCSKVAVGLSLSTSTAALRHLLPKNPLTFPTVEAEAEASTTMAPLPELSLDQWLMVRDLLGKSSLKGLMQSSKMLYAACLPILYSNIDLSVHHSKSYHEHDLQGIIIRWPKDEVIFGRQSLFMDTILFLRPEFAKLV